MEVMTPKGNCICNFVTVDLTQATKRDPAFIQDWPYIIGNTIYSILNPLVCTTQNVITNAIRIIIGYQCILKISDRKVRCAALYRGSITYIYL